VARLSLIDEHGEKRVRMAHLACVGSHAINGVAALHTELLQQSVLRDFAELWPERFSNKTNGVTPRRFLALANPELGELVTEHVGDGWATHLDRLRRLEPLADDGAFRRRWRQVKRRNKERLAAYVAAQTGITIDPDWLFDIQVKRIHEYKRQHLNILHIITLYQRLKENPGLDIVPRTFVFGGKAAPGYRMAKLMIQLITSVAEVVNHDRDVAGRVRVVFSPDFNVKNAQIIYPAADLSEQVSTAGYEASGTGNMKFALNGALTIGTLDGANIEIRKSVGAENFYLFGLTAQEVLQLRMEGYHPRAIYESNAELRQAIDAIASGGFSQGNANLFRPLVERLLRDDPFLVLADYPSYVACQKRVGHAYRDAEEWTRKSILNVARCGFFSSDRAIRQYAGEIWQVQPMAASVSG
jgi:starch phosphorylase